MTGCTLLDLTDDFGLVNILNCTFSFITDVEHFSQHLEQILTFLLYRTYSFALDRLSHSKLIFVFLQPTGDSFCYSRDQIFTSLTFNFTPI